MVPAAGATIRCSAGKSNGNEVMSTLRKRLIKARLERGGRARVKAANEARAIAHVEAEGYFAHVPSDVDVKGIRHRLGMSQDVFAERFGFTAARIRDWEQGRSKPDSAVRAYLMVIEREREAVERALAAGPGPKRRVVRGVRIRRAVRDDKALDRLGSRIEKVSNELKAQLEALRIRLAGREK